MCFPMSSQTPSNTPAPAARCALNFQKKIPRPSYVWKIMGWAFPNAIGRRYSRSTSAVQTPPPIKEGQVWVCISPNGWLRSLEDASGLSRRKIKEQSFISKFLFTTKKHDKTHHNSCIFYIFDLRS